MNTMDKLEETPGALKIQNWSLFSTLDHIYLCVCVCVYVPPCKVKQGRMEK